MSKVKFDMWYGDKVTDANKIDCFFNDLDGRYSGNLYKNGKAIGDYTAESVQAVEEAIIRLKKRTA